MEETYDVPNLLGSCEVEVKYGEKTGESEPHVVVRKRVKGDERGWC
jgi:hypothetical protein